MLEKAMLNGSGFPTHFVSSYELGCSWCGWPINHLFSENGIEGGSSV